MGRESWKAENALDKARLSGKILIMEKKTRGQVRLLNKMCIYTYRMAKYGDFPSIYRI